ncbi:MAG: slipin family protein [Chloroflexi bacterium]|jgi:regulator of protease activity HflC (stomatin/prohibitin superfamily)|nr:slipin family protein [Chloroflexota bacterium]
MSNQTLAIVIGVIVLLALIIPTVNIVWQYQIGVVFRLGKFRSERGPGINFIIPYIDRMKKIDMRVETLVVDPQEVITRDNVTAQVDAVVYYRVVNAQDAIIKVVDYAQATSQVALTTLRSVLGQSDLDELLSHRDRINERLQKYVDDHTEPWGVEVQIVEVKDVLLPERLQRTMARQAEAEREKRAKVIHADGERLAAEALGQAADRLSQSPNSMQLRYMQTLVEVASEQNATILPIPLDIIRLAATALKGDDDNQ